MKHLEIPAAVLWNIEVKKQIAGLHLKKYGKTENIDDYDSQEIIEMYNGIYRHKGYLKADNSVYVKMNTEVAIICEVATVIYKYRYNLKKGGNTFRGEINNIKAFYIKDYFLVEKEGNGKEIIHPITKFLAKFNHFRKGGTKFKGLYRIENLFNVYLDFNNKKIPKDIYHPIKMEINERFFGVTYALEDFRIKSSIDFF